MTSATRPGSLVVLGFGALPLIAWGFAGPLDTGVIASLLAGVLLVTLPAISVAPVGIAAEDDFDMRDLLRGSSLVVGTLGLVSLAVGVGELGWGGLPLALPSLRDGVVWGVGTGLAGIGVLVIARLVSPHFGWRETRLSELLLPRTAEDRTPFLVASGVAGVSEEFAYRGFLLSLLVATFDAPWTAALLSSLAFGVLHAYQGPLGIVRTGIIGFIFAGAVLVTGSLWPVVAGHVIINVVAGLVLGEWLLQRE